jgi:hypothetical protein
MKTLLGTFIAIVGLVVCGKMQGQARSPSAPPPKEHNMAAEIVEDEARALKAPTGFAGVKWLLNVDELKTIRPKVVDELDNYVREEMDWLGRKASVSYGFDNGLFVIAIITMLDATPADFEKTQKYLQNEYGHMPAATKTNKFVLSSTYKQGRFSIVHTLGPTKSEQVTLFRVKM